MYFSLSFMSLTDLDNESNFMAENMMSFFLLVICRPIEDLRGKSNPQSDDNSDNDNDNVSDPGSLHLSVREDFSQSLKLHQMSEERRQKLREIEVKAMK